MCYIIKYIFPILLLFCACLICSIKLQALDNWLFSSDLFSYDTMLQETLKGNFAVEYTYANFFGDHAYISFLLMLPLKILLGRHMVHLLVLLSPLFYLACGIGLFCYLYKRNIPLILFFVLSIGFLLHFEVFAGNYEGIYGFHFDNASGYVLFLIALLSVPYQGIFKPNPLWMIITLLFLLMKEEMALLGVIYFGVCWLLDRRKQWIQWTVTATLIFLIELLIIHHCKTPFNRGNILIIQQFFESLHTKGPCFWFTAAPMNAFWNYLILVSVTFVFLCISNR